MTHALPPDHAARRTALPAIAIASPLAVAAASADAHLIALGERLEGLLFRYIDAHLEWAPLAPICRALRKHRSSRKNDNDGGNRQRSHVLISLH